MSVTISVGIPTYLRDYILIDTIRQVLAQQPPANEIIIVDQTPSHDEQTAAFLREHHEQGLIRHIRQEQPSVTQACNRILVESTCDVVLFLDDDVRLSPGLIEAHRRDHEKSGVTLANGAVLQPSQAEAYLRDLENSSEARPADFHDDVRCGNMSVLRSAAIVAGGFDENFIGPAQGHENDFAIRLARIAGGNQIYDPAAWIIHLKAPTGGCRIIIRQNPAWTEWEKSYNVWLMGIRHHWPHSMKFIKGAVRCGPRRRENVLRFWRQPMAWISFCYGALVALSRKNNLRSPFVSPAAQGRHT